MTSYFIYYLIFFAFLVGQNNQQFIYKTKFKSFNVGTAEITINKNELDVTQKIITIESSSNKWIDLIYKLRHYSTLIIDGMDYSLLAMTQKIQQADYIDSYNATIDYQNKKIYYQSLKDNVEEDILIPIEGKIYEPFTIAYYLQTLYLDTNQKYLFNYYSKKTTKSLQLEVLDIETITTPYITKPCYVVVPQSMNQKSLLKNRGEMKIWYTADNQQIPIKIQQKMRHGIMELLLVNYVEE